MADERTQARMLAAQAVQSGRPLVWFEQLYTAARLEGASIPWADKRVNPHLEGWPLLDGRVHRRVLVVGCGLGDDAEWLSDRGLSVTAFDISPTAVAMCRERFPDSPVSYLQADLLAPPRKWLDDPFDLVVEAYTLQVLPPYSPERAKALQALASLTGGTLLVIARGRDEGDDTGAMPWPLTATELAVFEDLGLVNTAFDDYLDHETPPVRRFRSTYALFAGSSNDK